MNVKKISVNRNIVEIFKTNVDSRKLASKIVTDLNQLYPNYHINFDLEDCDRVLRIEGNISIDMLGILNYSRNNNIQIVVIDK